MTVSATGSSAGLRGQLNKLRNLAQPFFLPLDQATGWQFSGLLLALLFCVGGLVLVALTGINSIHSEQHQHDHAEHQPMQPATTPQLLTHCDERCDTDQEEGAERNPPCTTPDRLNRSSDTTEIFRGELREQLL